MTTCGVYPEASCRDSFQWVVDQAAPAVPMRRRLPGRPAPDEQGDDREDRDQRGELHRVDQADLSASSTDDERAGGQAEQVVGQGERAERGGTDRGVGQVGDHRAGRAGGAGGEERADRDAAQLHGAGLLREPDDQDTSEIAVKTMAVVHLRIGTRLVSRSVMTPQTIMPTPMSRMKPAAGDAAPCPGAGRRRG